MAAINLENNHAVANKNQNIDYSLGPSNSKVRISTLKMQLKRKKKHYVYKEVA